MKHTRIIAFLLAVFTIAFMLCMATSCSTEQTAKLQEKLAKANASYQVKTRISIGQTFGLLGTLALEYQKLVHDNAEAAAAAAAAGGNLGVITGAKTAVDVLP